MKIIAKTRKLIHNPSLFIRDYKAKRQKVAITTSSPSKKNEDKQDIKKEVKKKPPEYFQRVATSEKGQLYYDKLTGLCKLIKIPFMTGATDDEWMKGIHIDYADLHEFMKILQYWFSGQSYYLKVDNEYFLINDVTSKVDISKLKCFDLIYIEREYSTKSFTNKYYSLIKVYFWSLQDNYSNNSFYVIKENNKFLSKLTPLTFKELINNNHDLDVFSKSRAVNFSFPIDAVITWVDGDDPEWKKCKELYSNHQVDSDNSEGRATEDERFRNRNELKYLLRSIEMFAPFLRKIFIVTCGQVPDWLDTNNDRIVLVNHNEIYKNKEVLPTFNSSSIETQLHHIKDLSEHFIYFNDDFMLTNFCVPSDFFFANGVMKFFPSDTRIYEDDVDDSREEYLIADRNAINLIKSDFGKSGNDIMLHCPYPSRKSLLYFLEDRFESEYTKCIKERFRSKNDLRPIAFMQYHYGFEQGIAIPGNLTHRYLALYKKTIDKQFNGVFVTRKYKTICINDVAIPDDKLSTVDDLAIRFLESYFPFKSSFEK